MNNNPTPDVLCPLIHRTRPEDVVLLAPHIHPAEVREIWELHGMQASAALHESVARSTHCFTLWSADARRVLAIGGLTKPNVLWVLRHRNALKDPAGRRYFLENPRYVLARFFELCSVPEGETGLLTNCVAAWNKPTIRWLQALGARFDHRDAPASGGGAVRWFTLAMSQKTKEASHV